MEKSTFSRRFSSLALVELLLLTAFCAFSPLYAAGAEVRSSLHGGILSVGNGVIRLEITDKMQITPVLLHGDSALSVARAALTDPPAFYPVLGDLPVTLFRTDLGALEQTPVQDALGSGTRFILTGEGNQYTAFLYAGLAIQARVELTFYDKFPEAVVCRASFFNRGAQRLAVTRLVSCSFRLDRRLNEPEAGAWDFVSYQGAALRWGYDYALIPITRDFDRNNFMGTSGLASRDAVAGGTPLVDLWAPSAGLAIASAEPSQQWISLPVRTLEDGRVEVSLTEEPEERLGQKTYLNPGDSVSTVRSLILPHRLDFHDPIRSFARVIKAQGVEIPSSSPSQAYEPYWKSWGFRFDFTQKQILDALPGMAQVGLRWANLDDGWFTWYGDWTPNPAPGKFPGGEKDMVAFVSKVHKAGFKTSLWWYPQGVSAESDLEREHPDWLVQNEDGSLPLSKRGLHYLCPVYAPCIEFIRGWTRKIMQEWDYDGLYIDCQDLSYTPPCFNPVHKHTSPLESFQRQPEFYRAVFEEAQRLKPGSPIEMCICAMPHDPFKMPFYNVANTSDPVDLLQVRSRVKVEKAYRDGGTFCVGDCYQVPADEWEGFSVPESFESAMGTGAQVTTFYTDLDREQQKTWKRWIGKYRAMRLAEGEYLNLYDLAWDKPEGHVVRQSGKMYYGFFAPYWSLSKPITLRGLEKGRTYRVYDYAREKEMGTVTGDNPVLNVAFKEHLLLEVSPVK